MKQESTTHTLHCTAHVTHIIQTAVSADRTPTLQISHPTHDSRNSTRAKSGGPTADVPCESAEKLPLGEGGFEREEMSEDADDHEELVGWVAGREVR